MIIGGKGGADDILKLAKDSANSILAAKASQPTIAKEEKLGASDGAGGNVIGLKGTDSIFNPFSIFRYSEFGQGTDTAVTGNYQIERHRGTYQSNNIFGDVEERARTLELANKEVIQNPSAINIIEWTNNQALRASAHTGPLYPYPYQINDFLWCKNYGKIPNNRLLTLRRYPIPIEDNLGISKTKLPLVPIAQAVTWWGGDTGNALSSILGMTYGLKWEPITASIDDVQGNEIKFETVLDAAGIPKDQETLRKGLTLAFGQGDANAFSGYDATLQDFTKKSWEKGAYWNRVMGPINVIDSTQKRERGYTFAHDITLSFEYNLRSYGNINPKVAMLDLISNFMSLTYNRATFWGGGYRYFQQTGPLLGGFSTDRMEKGDYIGGLKDLSTYLGSAVQSTGDQIKQFVTGLKDKLVGKSAEEIETILTAEASGSETLNKLAASKLGKLQQDPLVFRALLDGRAVGEWHLMVGNPMDPLAVVGNLCLKSTSMTLSEELGADDFPTSIKFSVTLTPGRPRAKQDIESIFNHGGGDLSFTPLEPPASAMNSFGEYNSARIQSAYGPGYGTADNSAINKIKAGLTTSEKQYESGALNEFADDKGNVNKQAAEALAGYFKVNVANRYGAGFGQSPILVDYFTRLQTKD
jgi:hypothetical protein